MAFFQCNLKNSYDFGINNCIRIYSNAQNSTNGGTQSTSGAATKETCNWDYFVKIVAAPEDANVEDGFWYTADGTEIGAVIWGSFAIIQEVENDYCADILGAQYISPVGPGLGKW